MRSILTILCIAAICLLFIACPMQQAGMGPSRGLVEDSGTPGSGGGTPSVSVVNDEMRNVAVYINETGARIDVAAEEYPGGPLVTCVQLSDFTVVPQTGDSEALPVKVIVVGTREDGTPGVWEIHWDDSIHLPQPEQGDDGGARCIVGADMTTLPEGLQMRYGWNYRIKATSADGKLIVGYAEHPRGALIGGVQVLPGSKVALYWRVYRLPYSRFCVISPPRIIGTFEKQVIPAGWRPEGHDLPAILSQLKMFFVGKLESYLIINDLYPTSVITESATAGVYIVKSLDQDNFEAAARIDQTGVKSIFEVPNLEATLKVSPEPKLIELIDDPWTLSATVSNLARGAAQAPWTLEVWFSTVAPPTDRDAVPSSGDATELIHYPSSEDLPEALPGGKEKPFSIGTHTVKDLLGKMGRALPEPGVPTTYWVFARAKSVPKDYEGNLANNDPVLTLQVWVKTEQEEPPNLAPSLAITSGTGPVYTSEPWTLTVTLKNDGAGPANNVVVNYYLSYDDVFSLVDDKWVWESKLIDPIAAGNVMTVDEGFTLSQFDETGTHWVFVTVQADNQAAVASPGAKLSAYYNDVIVDTYKSTGKVVDSGPSTMVIKLYRSLSDGNGPDTSASGLISSADSDSYVDNSQAGYPYLDWFLSMETEEFAPGSTLWVQIYGNETNDSGQPISVPYAIRLLTKADPSVTGNHDDWFFTDLTDQQALYDAYEPYDATTLLANMPELLPQEKLHRALSSPDYDWVKIKLP